MPYAGVYYDGNSATARDVSFELSRASLRISEERGVALATWPARKIRRVDPILRGGPLRLRYKRKSGARLVVSDPESVAATLRAMPHLGGATASRRFTQTAAFLALITTIIVTALYFAIPLLAKPIADRVPFELEDRIGRSTLRTLTRTAPVCAGPGMDVLNDLAFRLSSFESSPYRITLVVIDYPVMNAFALPGGYIVVTKPMLDFMESGDELAGVLSHEIGHVKLRHPLEGLLSQVGVLLFVNMITGGSGTGDFVGLGAQIATTSYTREYERRADAEALNILTAAKIDPHAYAELFERFAEMEERQSDGLANLLRTHPYSEDRAAAAMAVAVLDAGPALNDQQWKSVKALCGGTGESAGENRQVDRNGRPAD